MELSNSMTLQALMRAFSGETQAWARYAFAEKAAETQGYYALSRLFHYTASQEKEHAELLWRQLRAGGEARVETPGDYPVDLRTDVLSLLQEAAEHERQEAEEIYPAFAKTAGQEGFAPISALFRSLADIERIHGQRFESVARQLQRGELLRIGDSAEWLCLYCGHVTNGTEPPAVCPVCAHPMGGFVPMELSPFQ